MAKFFLWLSLFGLMIVSHAVAQESAGGENMILVPWQAEWLFNNEVAGEDFSAVEVADSTWPAGQAGFGAEGTPGVTVNTRWDTSEIWLRKHFDLTRHQLNELNQKGKLYLSVVHDDDVMVYWNGTKIFDATGYVTKSVTIVLDQTSLAAATVGDNVLAVCCRQETGGQAIDLSIATTPPFEYKLLSKPMVDEPISDLLYSNFIELGYGIQVEPMWAEMFWNRSFERWYPYRDINIDWFDLWRVPGDPSQGYKTDWSSEDWYHSGYEHNPWFAAPGEGALQPIDENSTFVIPESKQSGATIQQNDGGVHGGAYLRVSNLGDAPAGLAQRGKVLFPDQQYRFRGTFRSIGTAVTGAEVRLYADGEWEQPIVSYPLETITTDWQRQTVELPQCNHSGRAMFALWIPADATVDVDAFSLMPTDTVHGWRPIAVELGKRVNPGVIRFPGGCFASFYDWRDGIGPHDQRNPEPSWFWGGLNSNDVGVAELALYSRAVGAEMMYCVNVYHPWKKDWDVRWHDGTGIPHGRDLKKFADLAEGAKSAADLVAYCNLPVGTHPMADLRAEHGYPEPFGIRYWELDNEVHRWFRATEYAEAAVVYSKAMKSVDPTIKIGLVTYGGRLDEPSYPELLQDMLEIAGPHIDFLADRRDSEHGLDHILADLRRYEEKSGHKIGYANTEWLAYDGTPDSINIFEYEGDVTKSYMFSKWHYAMNTIRNFMSWQRRGGKVWFVNFNNWGNTHAQNVLDTPKEGGYLSAVGRAFELLSRSPAAWPLMIEGYQAQVRDQFQVQAAWGRNQEKLVLYVFNRTAYPSLAAFDLSELQTEYNAVEIHQLLADGPLEMNTLEKPEVIRREDATLAGVAIREHYQIEVPPFSFTEVILW